MKNENLTEIVCILDRSGSMQSIIVEAIGGFNGFLNDQKKEPGDCKLTMVQFDDRYELVHNGVNIQDVPELTKDTYVPRGMTSLLDAIGKTINDISDRYGKTEEINNPAKTIFFILTDGEENSSKEFNYNTINKMITEKKDKEKWMFIFASSDIKGKETAKGMGIADGNFMAFANNGVSQTRTYQSVNSVMSRMRSQTLADYSATLDNALTDEEREN